MSEKSNLISVTQFAVPEPADVLAAIANVAARFDEELRPIAEWRVLYTKGVLEKRGTGLQS